MNKIIFLAASRPVDLHFCLYEEGFREGGVVRDGARVLADGEADVPVLAPLGAPRVADLQKKSERETRINTAT